jgi:hypothetical protein
MISPQMKDPKGGISVPRESGAPSSGYQFPTRKNGTVMVNDDQVTISSGHLSDRDIVYRCLAEDASDSEGESSSSPLSSYLDSSSIRRKLFNSILPSKAVYRAGQGGRQNPSHDEC